MNQDETPTVEQLIEAISKKLQANRNVVARSIAYGRVSWRLKNGNVELDVELKI